MATNPDPADLVASLHTHAQNLAVAASMDTGTIELSEIDEPVREMLMRSSELVRGSACLGQDENATCLGVIARALLENFISILWVQIDPAHASQLKQAAIAELARMTRLNLEAGEARILNRVTGEDATADVLASGRFKNLPRRTSVEERAKQAGIGDLYNVFYRALSMEVHGHRLGRPDHQGDLAFMHMQGIGAIALASGHAGVRWLLHRQRTDNETLRNLLGLGREL